MHRPVGCKIAFSVGLAFVLVLTQSTATAQYRIKSLVSNRAGRALHRDTNLVNSWGLAFSHDGARLAVSSLTTIFVLDVHTGEKDMPPIIADKKRVWSARFSPDGKRIVSSSGGKTILVHAIDW